MLQTLRRKFATLVIGATLFAVPVGVPVVAHAQANINNCVSQGSNLTIDNGTGCTPATTSTGTSKINNLITSVVNIFSAIVGIVSVIMIVVGGFQYITSGGDSGKVSTAKNTITYAIVGLIIVAFAQFLVQFVLNKVAGTA